MKIIDGQDIVMGRLASFVAKELLKGEEMNVINCNKVIISGSKKNIEKIWILCLILPKKSINLQKRS